MRETLSVVIPTRDRPELIARCLDSLATQRDPVDEVVVVDQSHGDETREICSKRASLVRHVPCPPMGSSAARNLGVSRATGIMVACTDDDCVAEPDWSHAFRTALQRHPEADGAFGDVLPGGALLEDVAGIEVSTLSLGVEKVHRGRTTPWRVGFGGNMVLRRHAWLRLGDTPFDEMLGPGSPNRGSNDMDIIYRLLREGAVLVSVPDARVRHEQWRTTTALASKFFAYGQGYGAFVGKYLFLGDRYALILLARQLGDDLRYIASGVRRRSRLRLKVGVARLAGTFRGLAAGRGLAHRSKE